MPEAPAQPHVFVVIGATGDLMQRKMLPALYRLSARGEFPAKSLILGAARHSLTDEAFQEQAKASLLAEKVGSPGEVERFCRDRLRFQGLGKETPEDYRALSQRIQALEKASGLPGNRVFYLALPLEAFGPTLTALGEAGLSRGPGFTRVVIEKPFGEDLKSAEALNALLHQHFEEKQVYRIDHYLGKETVQNLLVFRFANMFVESLWNRQGVDHVEITVAESLGLEGRAGYYETSGALRDMIQNHVTQILTLVAMEPPATRDEDTIRNEKVKVLRSAVRLTAADVVRGQYTAGTVAGKAVPGYREEPGVDPKSGTETFVALRMKIANWRWQGVPFFVRTGKRMPAKSTRVVVIFRAPPVSFFQSEEDYEVNPDRLTILVQPEEGFELAFEIKVPGRGIRVQTHRMKFHYADVFGELPDGYETLLLDVMLGDATLFVRADEVEESWSLYDPILKAPPPVVFYPAGTMGPSEATRLAEGWGHRWEQPAGAGLGRPATRVFPSLDQATRALSSAVLASAREAIAQRGRFHLVLSGGSTPRGLYERWGKGSRFPWQETEVYFADERSVSPRSSKSNYAMAREAFLSKVPVPRSQVHRLRGELSPGSRAAREYEGLLRQGAGSGARFDLVLLGIGKDGHTASLFPDAPALSERERWVVTVPRAGQPPFVPRLTMTLPALASSRAVSFLVAGADKAPAIRGIFTALPRGTERLPASLVRSEGPVTWFLDREAAAGLTPGQASPKGKTA